MAASRMMASSCGSSRITVWKIDAAVRLLSERRLMTLTGPGGVGRTRLAIRIAGTSAAAYPDGVPFVDLSMVTEPARVLERIGEVGAQTRESRVASLGKRGVLEDNRPGGTEGCSHT